MTTAEEVEAIKELDRLYITAKRTNDLRDWQAYIRARTAFERGTERAAERRDIAA